MINLIPHDQIVPTPQDLCEKILWKHSEILQRLYNLASEVREYYISNGIFHIHSIKVLEGASRTCDMLLAFIQELNGINPNTPPLVIHEDSVMISSYKERFDSNRKPKIIMPPKFPTKEHKVLIIEDIIDTGTAMSRFLHDLNHFTIKPSDIKLLTLIDKPNKRYKETQMIVPNFCGFQLLDDEFVIGFGLDYKHFYRNLPDIIAIKKEYRV